jgi:hypothetical protein
MFLEPITAKKWTTAAKQATANLSKKQTPKSPSKLHSARPQTDILQRTLSLPQNWTTAAKYVSVVRALSRPSANSAAIVKTNSPTPTNLQQVEFKIEYHCPPGYIPYTPSAWPADFPAPASMPVPPPGMSFPVRSLNTPVPPNCVIVPFKTRMLMPGETARPSEGNLIRETRSKTWASAETNHKLQL